MSEPFDLSLGLDGTHVLTTGAAGQIGSVVTQYFLAAGAAVTAWDVVQSRMTQRHERLHWDVVDITNESEVDEAFDRAVLGQGVVSACIALAGLDLSFIEDHQSICDVPLSKWEQVINTNLNGTFLTARAWLRNIRHAGLDHDARNISLVIIGSEAATWGSRSAAYSASKAAVQYGLMQSLTRDVVNVHPKARVNTIGESFNVVPRLQYVRYELTATAPGPVDTPQFRKECDQDKWTRWEECEATVALRQPVPMSAVARMCLILASENWSGSITGKVVDVDSGKSGKLQWKPEFKESYRK